MSNHHDWETLKQAYILSEIQSVKAFFRNQIGPKISIGSGGFKIKTKGWAQAKAEFKKNITDAVVNEAVKTRAELIANGKQASLEIIVGQLTTAVQRERLSKDDIDVGRLRALWEMIRLENGENIRDAKLMMHPPQKRSDDELSKSVMEKYENVCRMN